MARLTFFLATVLTLLASALAPLRAAPVNLIADRVDYDTRTRTLTASGNVAVTHEGRVLRAAEITYDAARDTVSARGPLRLSDAEGSVLLADALEMSTDLRDGIVRGARLLIDGRLQLAAAEMDRRGGRFNTLYRTVATSCSICESDPVPTWSVRARTIVQDDLVRRVYFRDATFELFGAPIFYLPRFSIPDPRLRRASGFLLPRVQQSDIYGFGLKLPYYHVIGPSADVTLTPFLTSGGATLIEGEYRRAFATGAVTFSGVYAPKDGMGQERRGSLQVDGAFRLGHGAILDLDLHRASDDSFLRQFDYSDDDRLTSVARVYRLTPNERWNVAAVAFQSLRDGESVDETPLVLPEMTFRRHGGIGALPGQFALEGAALGIFRGAGRDTARLGGGVAWKAAHVLGNGVVASFDLRTDVDLYGTRNDPARADGLDLRAVPAASARFSLPLVRRGAGRSEVFEPIVQVAFSDVLGAGDVPNEDSQLPELDATNLFSLNRFPGRDAHETGWRANLGFRYSRAGAHGGRLDLAFGRVLRADAEDRFAAGSGLSGRSSDYVAALRLGLASGLDVTNRALIGDDLSVRRNESDLMYAGERVEIGASYTYIAADGSNPILGSQPETNEVDISGSYRVRPNWEVRAGWRYDLAGHNSLKGSGGITYGNECAEFDVSVSRRFTSSADVPPSTSFAFGVRLAGIGQADTRDWPSRRCIRMGL